MTNRWRSSSTARCSACALPRRSFGPSSAAISYTLRAGSSRLDIGVELDWQHDEHLLTMRFPLDVRAESALCDIQFGVGGTTHPPIDVMGRFQVRGGVPTASVALVEPGFGAAVLNDGRYGHRGVRRRDRCHPGPCRQLPGSTADRGAHRVTLSLMAFDGDLDCVIAEAERLNRPVRVLGAGEPDRDAVQSPPTSAVDLTGAGVELDAVKLADDGSGDLVVRLHEHRGARQRITLRVPWVIGSAWRCNLLEERDNGFEVSDGGARVSYAPTVRAGDAAAVTARPESDGARTSNCGARFVHDLSGEDEGDKSPS